MSNDILAPIRINNLFLTDIQFQLANSPAEHMSLRVEENHNIEAFSRDAKTDLYSLTLVFRLDANLIDEDNPEDVLVHSHAQIIIDVSVPSDIDQSGQNPKIYLESNAISMAYAHARSSIMMLAGLSPMQSFVLPPILPYAVIADEDA